MSKKKTKQLTCKRCKYTWEPRKPNPVACPKCISRNWNSSPVAVKGKATKAKSKKAAPKKLLVKAKRPASKKSAVLPETKAA